MSVRTYCPSVRVGNWNEDIQLEEDTLKDFLEKKERGQLLIQQSQSLGATLLQQKDTSVSRDGSVHFGDVVMLSCPGAKDRIKYSSGVDPRDECSLAVNPADPSKLSDGIGTVCTVSGTKNHNSCLRSVFVIKSCDGSKDGEKLQYGQSFHISTLNEGGNLLLHSDRSSFQRCAKKSRHQEVALVSEDSYLTQWKVLYLDPRLRMEYEGAPVPANQPLIIAHCKTNQNLSVEQKHLIRTTMGQEYEISCHSYLNAHKAEEDVNQWMIKMATPGSNICPVATETSNVTSASSQEA